MKIALTMIVKDDSEAGNLKRCLFSIAEHVDGIFITSTAKPNKEIKKICKEFDANHSFFKWTKDFSAARNFNISQVDQEEYPWMFWCDSDDYVQNGENIRRVAEMAQNGGADAVYMNYVYALDDFGIMHFIKTGELLEDHILIEHLRERVLRNNGTFKWIAPIHETLIAQKEARNVDTELMSVVHLSTPERMGKNIHRNIDHLEIQLKGQKVKDPRTMYYLAKAYYDLRGESEEYLKRAWKLFMKYLKKSGWAEERCQAWEYLAEIYKSNKAWNKAEQCLFSALSETPKFPTTYISLANLYMLKGEWERALFWLKISARIEKPKTTLVMNPRDLITRSYEITFNCFLQLSQLDKAYESIIELTKYMPNDESLEKTRKWIEDLVIERDNSKKFVEMARYLEQTGEVSKLIPLLAAAPKNIENNPFVTDLRNKITPPKVWEDNEIAILCGPGFELWDADSIKKGLGGSEEAIVYLSRELCKLGWKVTVYGDPIREGNHDGVRYLSHYQFNIKDKFNVLVVWRAIGNMDIPFDAKTILFDMHDLPNVMEYTKERVRKVDKFMVKSKYQRDLLPDIPDNKFVIVGNGI